MERDPQPPPCSPQDPHCPPPAPSPTHTATGALSLGCPGLYLQNVFHSVSTKVNCRLIITSTIACGGGGGVKMGRGPKGGCGCGGVGADLAVLAVQQLEGAHILGAGAFGQSFAVQLQLREVGQRPGGVCGAELGVTKPPPNLMGG